MLKIVNDIRVAAGEGKCTVLLALDISAAFDVVDHTILCQRLESLFGLNGSALSWITSFLSDRSQYEAVGNERCSLCFWSTTGLSARPVALLSVCCASE